jgi:hypothetical protein
MYGVCDQMCMNKASWHAMHGGGSKLSEADADAGIIPGYPADP